MKPVKPQEVLKTDVFSDWLDGLKDKKTRGKIIVALEGLEKGNFGDSKPVGDGVSELRLHFGPGYRVYHMKYGGQVLLLLCGGEKSSQPRDIKKAKSMKKEVDNL